MEKKKLNDTQILSILHQKIDDAMNSEEGDISTDRQGLLDAFRGRPYGNERDDRSKYVDRSAYIAVESAHPEILKPFIASARPMEFAPTGPEDVVPARHESDVANYYLMKANNAYQTCSDWIREMLIYHNAYTKMWMEESTTIEEEHYVGLLEDEVTMLAEEDGVEIKNVTPVTKMVDMPYQPPMPGAFPPKPVPPQKAELVVYDVDLERTDNGHKLRFESIAPDQVLVERGWTKADLDDCGFVAHRVEKTRTELLEMGVDEDTLEMVGSNHENHTEGSERINRFLYEDAQPWRQDESVDPSMRKYWYHECYVMMDSEGTGRAQRRKVCLVGDQIFENEPIPYQPFLSLTYTRVPHTHVGIGMVETVASIQKVLTQLVRQMLDSVYKKGTGRLFVWEKLLTDDGETEEGLEDVLSDWVKTKLPPGEGIMPDVTESLVTDILPLVNEFQNQQRARTGAAPDSLSDPTALQRAPATPAEFAQVSANSRIEGLQRHVGESGMKRAMLKAHTLLRLYQDKALHLKLREELVAVDPSGWRKRVDVEVRVGLGFHNREKLMQLLQALYALMKEAQAMGMVNAPHFHALFRRVVEGLDLGDVRTFFDDPTREGWQPPPPPPPGPDVILANAQAENLKEDNARKMAELQHKQGVEAAKLQMEREKAQAEAVQKQLDTKLKLAELEAKRQETQLKMFEAQARYGLTEEETRAKIRVHDAEVELKGAQTVETYASAEATLNPPETPKSDEDSDDS